MRGGLATTAADRAMPSGTYLVRLEAQVRVRSRLIALVR